MQARGRWLLLSEHQIYMTTTNTAAQLLAPLLHQSVNLQVDSSSSHPASPYF